MVGVIAAGLPNITGRTSAFFSIDNKVDGAFTYSEATYNKLAAPTGGYTPAYNLFSASNSNSLYGMSETVQPPTLQMIPQIKF